MQCQSFTVPVSGDVTLGEHHTAICKACQHTHHTRYLLPPEVRARQRDRESERARERERDGERERQRERQTERDRETLHLVLPMAMKLRFS